jgi:hypothetical protein
MEIIISKNYRLQRLHYWLKYELSSSVLLLLSWLGSLLILLATFAAILFTPYMLTILFKEKKFGWVTSFIITVLLPAVFIWIYFSGSDYSYFLFLIPLAFFYFYCFLLRITVHDWLT